jgi:hypothetical protein
MVQSLGLQSSPTVVLYHTRCVLTSRILQHQPRSANGVRRCSSAVGSGSYLKCSELSFRKSRHTGTTVRLIAALPREARLGCSATRLIIQDVLGVYKRETREVIRRFFLHQLSFPSCVAALDAALTGVVPRLRPEELCSLPIVMLAKQRTGDGEMVRRTPESQSGKPS